VDWLIFNTGASLEPSLEKLTLPLATVPPWGKVFAKGSAFTEQ
jgi:hypothetical protein